MLKFHMNVESNESNESNECGLHDDFRTMSEFQLHVHSGTDAATKHHISAYSWIQYVPTS